jgi:hypothetical protein
MNTILNRIDRLMMAITFAEANEAELAQEYIPSRKTVPSKQAEPNTTMTSGQILPTRTAH